MKPTRAAIYCRISRDREGSGLGVERQELDCRGLADKLGWDVVRVDTDNDISAASGKRRPGYEALLAAVVAGEVDSIIAWHADRLHRIPAELERFVDIVRAHHVSVQTVRAGELDLSNPTGLMVARILGSVASHEVEQTRGRIKRQKQQAVSQGAFRGGPRPFGYSADGMTVVESEAQMIRDAAQNIVEGASLRSIAAAWNAAGSRTTKGNEWSPFALKWTVLKYRNAGKVEHNGEPVADGAWPAIMSMDELLTVRAVLTSPARRTQRGTVPKWLGSGLYVCGRTGGILTIGMSGTDVRYRLRGGESGGVSRSALLVDAVVNETMSRHLASPDADGWFAEEQKDETAAWRTERDGLQARMRDVSNLYAADGLSLEQLTIITAGLRERIEALDVRINAAGSVPELSAVMNSGDVDTAWRSLPLRSQRAILSALVTVTILPAPHRGAKFDPDLIVFDWHEKR